MTSVLPISEETNEKLNRLSVLLGKEKHEIVREALKFKLNKLYGEVGGDIHADLLSR